MKTIIRFFLFFLGTVGIIIILYRMGFKSVAPQTWLEIYEDLPFIIGISLLSAIIFTIIAYFESGNKENDKKK